VGEDIERAYACPAGGSRLVEQLEIEEFPVRELSVGDLPELRDAVADSRDWMDAILER
jgi:hypothetical protein